MITELLPELEKLRAIGVRKFSMGDLAVEFSDPEPPAGAIVPREFTQNAPHKEDECGCGHAIPAHDPSGLCLLGCEAVKCAAGPKP